jgi:DNA-binding response OmpR family regulator
MLLLALLVSTDDSACEILGRVLPALGIAVERFSDPAGAIDRLRQRKFDALILDYENSIDNSENLNAAAAVLAEARRLNSGNAPVTVALISERARTREILGGGAHFLLYKPLSDDTAAAGLRAVAAILTRERRRAHRVSVQAPVELVLPGSRKAEGILLDLSETGMEVLIAEPQVAGTILHFRFQFPGGEFEVEADGQVAWANPNGQTGVQFLNLQAAIKPQLQAWLQCAAFTTAAGPEEMVPHCTLSDLSLGGCYVETDSPFPENALIDLCLAAGEMSVHTEGLVRVMHPGYGMGVEFPSRTPEQRAQVGDLIAMLRACPQSMLELSVSPRELRADLSQFKVVADPSPGSSDELEDPLLDLLRQGCSLQQDEFLSELRRQRSGESVTA